MNYYYYQDILFILSYIIHILILPNDIVDDRLWYIRKVFIFYAKTMYFFYLSDHYQSLNLIGYHWITFILFNCLILFVVFIPLHLIPTILVLLSIGNVQYHGHISSALTFSKNTSKFYQDHNFIKIKICLHLTHIIP